MKIAIPVNENNMNTTVCMSFGRTPYFLIHDTNSKADTFLANAAANASGGAGIQAAQMIADNKVEALLAPRCGGNAADVLNAANINIYKTVSYSLDESIKAFENNQLNLLNEIHPGFHNHG